MKGWFDAFRSEGGPTLYNFNNRTAVTGDVTIIIFLTIFSTLYIAFLIIFPGIRKEKFTTFFTVTLSLFVGATILLSLFGSGWHIANTSIDSSYKAFSDEHLVGDLGVFVGLEHVNITLQGSVSHNRTPDVDFNERFYLFSSCKMKNSFQAALFRGLPYPILTVAEYFHLGQDGLSWSGQYRSAGYFAIIMLWTSFSMWLLMNLMIVVVPRYGAVLMTVCGLLLLGTACGYFRMLPESPLLIHVEGSTLHFCLGWCYWLVFIAGCICVLSGVIITSVEIISPNSFSTILEVDYDTPYDRHIIIEDSHGKRFQKKRSSNNKLEEPSGVGLGTRILRRLSSKTHEQKNDKTGAEAQSISLELQKSPWRCQFKHPQFSSTGIIPRAMTHESIHSNVSKDLAPTHKSFSRLRTHHENAQEVSMW